MEIRDTVSEQLTMSTMCKRERKNVYAIRCKNIRIKIDVNATKSIKEEERE